MGKGKDESIFDMTAEAFAEKHPDDVKSWKAEAAQEATAKAQDAERQRFGALQKAFPNHAGHVAACFLAGDTVEEAKSKFADVLAAENKKLQADLAAKAEELTEAKKGVGFHASDEQTEETEADGDKPKTALSVEDKAKKEFAESEDLRAEFRDDEAAYVAYVKAKAAGRVREGG